MKKRVNLKNRVSALVMSIFLMAGLITPSFSITANAEASEVLNATCTVADMIFSYCASGGVAVMNETVIDEVYNVLGTSFGTLQTFVDNGLLTYSDGSYVDTGLSTNISNAISSINSIDIGALFNQTAEQNPAGVALTGASSLAGIAGSVASSGFLPVVAGVAITGYCGFQIGTLIANFLGLYDKNMALGLPISSNRNVISEIPYGVPVAYYGGLTQNGDLKEFYLYGDGISYSYPSSNTYVRFGLKRLGAGSSNITRVDLLNGNVTGESHPNLGNYSDYALSGDRTYGYSVSAANMFDSASSANAAFNNWSSGHGSPKTTNRACDVIGTDGNIQGSYDNNAYNFPTVTPQIDPSTQSINPQGLSLQDWLNFANNSNTNNSNGNPDLNRDLFNDILDAIRINEPTPIPTPAPTPVPDPEPYPDSNPDPETVPVTVPTVNPYPESYPVADPESVPDNPEQPQYTEKPTENETDIVTGDPYTTPDLLDKFPFCIPRDILRAFKKLDSGSREAPHIQWRFHPNEMIDHTFDVDFSVWENIASLLRLLELIAFVIALGIATRNLILS